MDADSSQPRRNDFVMAEKVQQGVSLLLVAGSGAARHYLLNCDAPAHVIERVLSAQPGSRRVYGLHGESDRRGLSQDRPTRGTLDD
jgi:hypothetical protein